MSVDNAIELQVSLDKDTVWLNQAQMASLFMQTKQNVRLPITNSFKEKEIEQNSVVKEYLTTDSDGKKYKTKFHNLDVIISVGYRMKSKQGTPSHQCATQH